MPGVLSLANVLQYFRKHGIHLGASACLLGHRVRYAGRERRHTWLVQELGAHVTWLPVCPEVQLGLGVPRSPIGLVRPPGDQVTRLIALESKRDVTEPMPVVSAARMSEPAARGIAGYVLKSRSPSCRVSNVEVLDHAGGGARCQPSGRGLFAHALMRCLPGLSVIEDYELDVAVLREAFVRRVFGCHQAHGRRSAGHEPKREGRTRHQRATGRPR